MITRLTGLHSLRVALNVVMPTLLIAAWLALAYCVLMLIRNERVSNYRKRIIEEVSKQSKRDISRSRSWEWRYEAYSAVSYEAMMKEWWRPLASFYPDKRFLEEDAVP